LRGGLPLKLPQEHGRVVGINILKHRLASEGFGEVVDETPEVSSVELLGLGFDALVDEEALDDRFEGRISTQLVPPQCSGWKGTQRSGSISGARERPGWMVEAEAALDIAIPVRPSRQQTTEGE